MPPVRFEPTIPESARPQTYALDRAATGIGRNILYEMNCLWFSVVVQNALIAYLNRGLTSLSTLFELRCSPVRSWHVVSQVTMLVCREVYGTCHVSAHFFWVIKTHN
jgi:hypothetical protein